MDWKAMMRDTSPIFLLLAIFNKTWILQVRKKVEHTLNFSIVKDMNYDGERRCYDFAHTFAKTCEGSGNKTVQKVPSQIWH